MFSGNSVYVGVLLAVCNILFPLTPLQSSNHLMFYLFTVPVLRHPKLCLLPLRLSLLLSVCCGPFHHSTSWSSGAPRRPGGDGAEWRSSFGQRLKLSNMGQRSQGAPTSRCVFEMKRIGDRLSWNIMKWLLYNLKFPQWCPICKWVNLAKYHDTKDFFKILYFFPS